jgi:Flp pilus assembly protein TadG
MLLRTAHNPRRAATTVEFAVACPVAMLLVFGLIIGALGVFRYQQVANLAREAARWASVHGSEYQRETHQPAATQASIYRDVVLPRAAGLDSSQLQCTVTWNRNNAPTYEVSRDVVVTNIVTVTVTYQWVPEAYLGGITLTSTSRVPMSY